MQNRTDLNDDNTPSFSDLVLDTIVGNFQNIFPPLGMDTVNNTLNGKSLPGPLIGDNGEPVLNTLDMRPAPDLTKRYTDEQMFLDDPLTVFTSFFGIPNRRIDENNRAWNILKNLVGWQDNGPTYSPTFNFIYLFLKWVIVIPWNIIAIPSRFAINVLTLFTEFLPMVLKILSTAALQKFREINLPLAEKVDAYTEKANTVYEQTIGNVLKSLMVVSFVAVGIVLTAISILSTIWSAIGAAITSPIKSVTKNWKSGEQLENKLNEMFPENHKLNKALGLVASVLTAAVSAGFTLSLYGVLFPYAFHFFAVAIAPTIASHLPVVAHFAQIAIAKMTPALTYVGHAVSPIIDMYFPHIIAQLPTAAVGFGAISGLAVCLANPVVRFVEHIQNKLHQKDLRDDIKELRDAISEHTKPIRDRSNNALNKAGNTIKSSYRSLANHLCCDFSSGGSPQFLGHDYARSLELMAEPGEDTRPRAELAAEPYEDAEPDYATQLARQGFM